MVSNHNKSTVNEFSKPVGSVVNANAIFNSNDIDAKNKELIKLLQVCGMNPNETCDDPKLQEELMRIIQNFDHNKKFTDDDNAFAVQNAKFSHLAKNKKLRSQREADETKADKSYY